MNRFTKVALLTIVTCCVGMQAHQTQSDYEREQKFKTESIIRTSFFIQGTFYGSLLTSLNNGCSRNVTSKIIAALLCQLGVIVFFELAYPSKIENITRLAQQENTSC